MKLSNDEGTVFHVTWEVDADKDAVAEYYKDSLPENGYTISNTLETPEGVLYTIEEQGTVQIAVTEDEKTQIRIRLIVN